jgi:hypothetical protein
MSDDKKVDPTKITNEVLLADVMIRVTALERVLIKKGIISVEEFSAEVDVVANQVSEAVLKSVREALVPTIDELIGDLNGKNPLKN